MENKGIGELLEEEAENVEKTLLMATRMIDLARKEQKLSEDRLESESTGSTATLMPVSQP